MKEGEIKKTIKTADVWKCDRCGTANKVPCPRGGCEGKIVGEIETITIETYREFLPEEQHEVNIERGSIYYYDKNDPQNKHLFRKKV